MPKVTYDRIKFTEKEFQERLSESYDYLLAHEDDFFNFNFHLIELLKLKGGDHLASHVVSTTDVFKLLKRTMKFGKKWFMETDIFGTGATGPSPRLKKKKVENSRAKCPQCKGVGFFMNDPEEPKAFECQVCGIQFTSPGGIIIGSKDGVVFT